MTRPTNGWSWRLATEAPPQIAAAISWATLCAHWGRVRLVHSDANGQDRGRGPVRNRSISEILMRKTLARVLAAVTIAATLAATATDASAQWRRGGWGWGGGPGWGWHGGGWRGPGVGV